MTTPSNATTPTACPTSRIARVLLAAAMALALLAAPETGLRAADVAKTPARGPAPQPPKPRTAGLPPRPHPTNPHVHVQSTTKKPATATPAHVKTTSVHTRKAHSHVRVSRPTGAHGGRGTIAGVVRNADYRPVGGVFVRLAKPGGRRFRNAALRHGTYTRNDGSFVMRAVRGGRYRVNASKRGVGHGYTPAHLAGAGYERVTIDLTSAPAKHRKHK